VSVPNQSPSMPEQSPSRAAKLGIVQLDSSEASLEGPNVSSLFKCRRGPRTEYTLLVELIENLLSNVPDIREI
jgi:hypothetical protein